MTSRYILFVEDDRASRDSLRELLIREGYQISEAATAEDGLSLLYQKCLPDLILVGLRPSSTVGESFIQGVRGNRIFKKIPIIVLSGHINQSFDYGTVFAMIQKPVSDPDLIEKVRQALNK